MWYVLLDFKCSGMVITPNSLLQLCMNIEESLLKTRKTTRNTRYLQRYSCYLGMHKFEKDLPRISLQFKLTLIA